MTNNTKIVISEEYHNNTIENDKYVTEQLMSLNVLNDNIECVQIEKIKWSDWNVYFNRKLSRLEEEGIRGIANADSITIKRDGYLEDVECIFTYALWWD